MACCPVSKISVAFLAAMFLGAVPAETSPPDEIGFTDAVGRAVRLERIPQRLVVIGHGPHMIAHLLYMFPEGRERLVAVESRGSSASDFLSRIDPAFARKPRLGTNPGPESVAALRPDLVLIRGTSPDPRIDPLIRIGLKVAYLGLETPDLFDSDLRILGRILGNPSRAEEAAAFFRTRLERIDRVRAGIGETERPSVLVAMTIPSGDRLAVQVPAPGWIQTIQVLRAGGRPVWTAAAALTSGWTVVNLEQIARWNPDEIILVVWHSMDPAGTLERFQEDPRWASLKAVRTGAVRAFPGDIYGWDNPDPRWILGLTWMAKALHPGLYRDVDMTAEVGNFYGELFGMTPEQVAAVILPEIRVEFR